MTIYIYKYVNICRRVIGPWSEWRLIFLLWFLWHFPDLRPRIIPRSDEEDDEAPGVPYWHYESCMKHWHCTNRSRLIYIRSVCCSSWLELWNYITSVAYVWNLDKPDIQWMIGILGHNSALLRLYWSGDHGRMRWILLWNMPLVQDRSLDLLASSPTRYQCTTDASTKNYHTTIIY